MNKTQILNDNCGYTGVQEGFENCAGQCADADMLLQRFLDIVTETQENGEYLIFRLDEENPHAPLITSSGFNSTHYKHVVEKVDSWVTDPDTLHQLLAGDPEMFVRELDIYMVPFKNVNPGGSRTVLYIGRYRQRLFFNQSDIKTLKMLINTLESSLERQNLQQVAYPQIQKIIDAKQQWESTVDALDVLICLLDKDGKVFRVNKTLEKWNLGSVRCVKGIDVHDLLHPECYDPKCALKLNWLNLWKLPNQSKVEETSEFYDWFNQCELRMTLLRGKISSDFAENAAFSTLIIEDTSESKWSFKLLEEYSKELYSQIQNQNKELNNISTRLQNRIDEHSQDKKQLQVTEERLLSLSSKLLTAQELERKRIAAELHDGVGQSISAIKFNLEGLLANKAVENDPQQQEQQLLGVISRLRDAVEEVRRISMGLRPSMIDELGLLITIQWLCRTFQSDFPALKLEQELDINEHEISEIQKVSIFRIIQEAFNNISKYAQADKISLSVTTHQSAITLNIEDNGVGFEANADRLASGFGLCSMKERANLSGGSLSIYTSPGKGTIIKATW